MKKHLRMATLAFAATTVILTGCADDGGDTAEDTATTDDAGATDEGATDEGATDAATDAGTEADAGMEEEEGA